jgi:hypothetical protein
MQKFQVLKANIEQIKNGVWSGFGYLAAEPVGAKWWFWPTKVKKQDMQYYSNLFETKMEQDNTRIKTKLDFPLG